MLNPTVWKSFSSDCLPFLDFHCCTISLLGVNSPLTLEVQKPPESALHSFVEVARGSLRLEPHVVCAMRMRSNAQAKNEHLAEAIYWTRLE